MALAYHESYSRTILTLYLFLALKRILTEEHFGGFKELKNLALSCLLFYLMKRLYSYNDWTIKWVPLILAVFSYYSHSAYVFRGFFDESPLIPQRVHMSKDDLFRHIIKFASMSLSLVYICVFLLSTRR